MKMNLKTLAAVLSLCALATSSKAAVILSDNFESYAQGNLPTNTLATSPWLGNTGNPATGPLVVVADPTSISANALKIDQSLTQDGAARFTTNTYASIASIADVTTQQTNVYGAGITNTTYGFSSSNSVNALYASMTIYVTTIPATGSQTYFTHFTGDSAGQRARIFIITNGAASGKFRLAVQNATTGVTNVITTDFSPNTAYTLVSRYVLGTASSTIWVNPANEGSGTSATALDVATPGTIHAYGCRQNTGEGVVDVDNLLVGTTFADVVPGSVNPPVIVTQPQDNTTVFTAQTATFTNLALGDPTITYQWYYNTNTLVTNNTFSVSGATTRILTMTNLALTQSGTYSCVSSNTAGTNVTRFATLLVNSIPVPPTITNQPAGSTNNLGDTVALTVGASGLPLPTYQWKFVTNNVTNLISGATSATYSFTATNVNQSGQYFVTLSNSVGVSNSVLATVQINPIPTVSIAQFRSMVDSTNFAPTNTTSIYSLTGTVTTWTNMVNSTASTEFYMQDGTGGIAVFWSGAVPSTNLPPAGAQVRVVGPMAAFNGLIEIEPFATNSLHSVTVLSTNNPLPVAQPLVFDPNINGYPATTKNAAMASMESMYFVASNVFLNMSSPTFVSGNNDIITNNANKIGAVTNSVLNVTFTNQQGQQFILFVNAVTDLPNKSKPAGPVTIYGILGYFTAQGFEFTPSRFADIISYVHVTNVLTHARQGDLATNSYTELVLRPGETLNTHVSIGDAAGGTVTLTPDTSTLSPRSSWSGITSGLNATGNFTFSPTSADAGSNYVVNLAVTSTAGTSYTYNFTVYVPTADEQQIYLTEILANPTTNTASPFYNPLARSTAVTGISTNDQYVEIANLSSTDFNGFGSYVFTIDTGIASSPKFSSLDGAGADLPATGSLVVYGGNGSPSSPPTLANTAVSRGLSLSTSGATLVLRNGANYPSPGYIIDRVVYSASDISTNGSISRFPTVTNGFVPQAYISTNHVTPNAQYDGGAWSSATSIPQGVSNVTVTASGNQIILHFTANTSKASTLWRADDLMNSIFSVVNGGQFGSSSATFTETNSQAKRFYYITTQQ